MWCLDLKITTWPDSESVVSSDNKSDQPNYERIGSGITPMFGKDGYTVTPGLYQRTEKAVEFEVKNRLKDLEIGGWIKGIYV